MRVSDGIDLPALERIEVGEECFYETHMASLSSHSPYS